MVSRGWNRKSLQPGDAIKVTFNPAQKGGSVGRLIKLIKANGEELGRAWRSEERMKMRNRSPRFLSFRAKRGISHRFCSSALWLLGMLGLISGCSAKTSAKPVAQAPDLSGIWQGVAIQSLSPSDPMAKKPGAEGDIPYTPWALERMKSERPVYGPNASLGKDHGSGVEICRSGRLSARLDSSDAIQNCANPGLPFINSGNTTNPGGRLPSTSRIRRFRTSPGLGNPSASGKGTRWWWIRWASRIPRGSIPSATRIPKISTSSSASVESTRRPWFSTLRLTTQRPIRNPGTDT